MKTKLEILRALRGRHPALLNCFILISTLISFIEYADSVELQENPTIGRIILKAVNNFGTNLVMMNTFLAHFVFLGSVNSASKKKNNIFFRWSDRSKFTKPFYICKNVISGIVIPFIWVWNIKLFWKKILHGAIQHLGIHGPRQANLVLIAYASSEGSGEPAHPRSLPPEPSLLAHTNSESRGTFRQKARSLAPLNGWACTVKICHDGMLEDTNSLDGAHIITSRSDKEVTIFGGLIIATLKL